jgi:hypothetical protein
MVSYWVWHYTAALPLIYSVWRNLLWYVVHLFSTPLLLRTLVAPWKRITEDYAGGGVGEFASIIILNMLSRVVGFCIRLPLIIIGLIAILLACVGLVAFYVLWLAMPFLLMLLISYGFMFLYAA